ncbi:hypothetical protein ADK60_26485 [Streptomyces sp. XY431]|uniref:hypothetical protein n=1 Tax=Streptomyces sp. XY431 TaxID=1415562 RepID=UPI0006AF83AD|nr:hypothetical protein [Streptomyces sp. XY431]KOV20368.1 hypothetical protein ADK60_26485 [Streptomyces sp. XY431]
MNGPIDPHDKILRTYTEPEVTALLLELHERGRPLGLRWGSISVSEPTIDGRLLVDFGDAPVSTLLNLLTLLREVPRK